MKLWQLLFVVIFFGVWMAFAQDFDWRGLFQAKFIWKNNPAKDWTVLSVTAGVAALFGIYALSPPYVKIQKDGIVYKDFFGNQSEIQFSDIDHFENRFIKPLLAKSGDWQVFVVFPAGRDDLPLPKLGKVLFPALKAALNDWQTAHGKLRPTRFANFSDNVRL